MCWVGIGVGPAVVVKRCGNAVGVPGSVGLEVVVFCSVVEGGNVVCTKNLKSY